MFVTSFVHPKTNPYLDVLVNVTMGEPRPAPQTTRVLRVSRPDGGVLHTALIVHLRFLSQIYWFKDGKQISAKNDHYSIQRDLDGTCSLHTMASTLDDDGNYTVMAANPQVKEGTGPVSPACSWPLNNAGVGCTGLLVHRFSSVNTVNVFSLPSDVLNNFFSPAYCIVRIQEIIQVTYKICVN